MAMIINIGGNELDLQGQGRFFLDGFDYETIQALGRSSPRMLRGLGEYIDESLQRHYPIGDGLGVVTAADVKAAVTAAGAHSRVGRPAPADLAEHFVGAGFNPRHRSMAIPIDEQRGVYRRLGGAAALTVALNRFQAVAAQPGAPACFKGMLGRMVGASLGAALEKDAPAKHGVEHEGRWDDPDWVSQVSPYSWSKLQAAVDSRAQLHLARHAPHWEPPTAAAHAPLELHAAMEKLFPDVYERERVGFLTNPWRRGRHDDYIFSYSYHYHRVYPGTPQFSGEGGDEYEAYTWDWWAYDALAYLPTLELAVAAALAEGRPPRVPLRAWLVVARMQHRHAAGADLFGRGPAAWERAAVSWGMLRKFLDWINADYRNVSSLAVARERW